MEHATPPPETARAPVAWNGWWLMPLAFGAGTVATAVAGPDQVQIPATFAGAAATVASGACVRILLRAQAKLRRATADVATAQAEQGRQAQLQQQQWEQYVARMKEEFAGQRSALEGQLTEAAQAHEAKSAETAQAYEAQLAEAAQAYEAQLAEAAQAHEGKLSAEVEGRQEQVALQLAVIARLAGVHLPQALERLRAGDAIDDVLAEVEEPDASPELRAEVRKVLRTALIGVEEELDRATSAEHAVVSIGSRLQVLIGGLRGRLHELQTEHGRLPALREAFMFLDARLGPAVLLATSISVLGGSVRPGRQWQEPQNLLRVVRGGIGQINDFGRVKVGALPELGVDGGLVDDLTTIFGHLLDNAARYSPPSEPVVVSGREVPNGVGIEIQDVGKGLSEEKKREAEQALAGTAAGPGLGGISEGANLGLRTVGILARRYGIRVTLADSPWLGTSVVVVVPGKYFSALPTAVTEPASRSAAVEPSTASVPVASARTAKAQETTPGGLPKRRAKWRDAPEQNGTGPRQDAPERSSVRAERPDEAAGAVPSPESFAGLAAFATAGGLSDLPGETTADNDAAGSGETAGRKSDRTEESD
ncbi:ATP-binding protein [Streptomyces sp. A475]|uniref:sensor histidine kinase n=1 Tax=Streptomyces sp. A475 TaxID=3131976 RepID=UPI0030C9E0ED